VSGALEKATQLNLIRRLRGEDARYEVSPALELVFPAEQIQALTETYARLSASGASDPRGGALAEDGGVEEDG
jgi:hypothetical protein